MAGVSYSENVGVARRHKKQGCARGLFVETETKAFRARDRDEAEAYQHCGNNFKARPSLGTTAPRDGLETEATSHIIPRTDVVL